MNIKVVHLITVILWTGLTSPLFAFGADPVDVQSTIKVDVKNMPALLDAKSGRLLIVAFKDGMPATGVAVRTPQGVRTTDSAGVISLNLSAPQEHIIEVVETEQKIKVQIQPDQESQVIVNLLVDKKSQAAVEVPQSKQQNSIANGPKKTIRFDVDAYGKGISEATLLFSGLDTVYKTDMQGRLTAEIPQGTYSVSVFHPNYQTFTVPELKVGAEGAEHQKISLKAAENQLEEVLVLAPKIKGSLSSLVEVRKQSSAVTDVLGAEQMARAGDGDAAASLRRVTGLTLVGGKFVYVRGLGERYSGVQMNNFQLPSPEPARRVVPLDLFPTSIMESIVVQKSYSPDMPGEFGGGIIQLQTRSLPEDFFFRASLTTNYENLDQRLDHAGGSTDWLGIDDGGRKMPAAIKAALAKGKQLSKNVPGFSNGLSEAELTALGQSLTPNYNTSSTDAPASLPGLAMSMGNGWRFSGVKVGTAGSLLYGQTTDQLSRSTRTMVVADASGKLAEDSRRSSDYTEVETRLAGSLDAGVELFKDHKFVASTFLLRNTTKLTQLDRTEFASSAITEGTTMDFTERQLWTRHFKGEHQLERAIQIPLKVDWKLGWADADRNSPDRREIAYNMSGGTKAIFSDAAGNRRTYSELTDATQERGINFTMPFKKDDREYLKFKVGLSQLEKNRRSDVTRLYFANDFSGNAPVDTSKDANTIFDPANIKPGSYVLKNLTNEADSYSGQQTINAQYAMMEVSPWETWSFQAGLRREKSVQDVNTFRYFEPGNPFATSSINMRDSLPSYGVVWKPTEALRARVAYSETLARPDFREMSTVAFIDDETGYLVKGNPDLKGTVIRNIDHRWEYYFTSDEYASVGVFYKQFKDPVEVLFEAGVNRIQTFGNAKEANNYGIELEGRAGLRHFSRFMRRWTVLSNLTLIKSEIELDEKNKGIQTSEKRALQGQSPYAVNLQLQYDRPNWGFTSTVLYNVVGKRITEVGTNGIPDTYEQPFDQLDFVATQKFSKNWTVSFRARNLLNPDIESTQADEVVRTQKRGRTFGVVLGAVF